MRRHLGSDMLKTSDFLKGCPLTSFAHVSESAERVLQALKFLDTTTINFDMSRQINTNR